MTSESYILAIDEGTTNAKAMLLNARGQIVNRASRPLTVNHPRDGWVEQDPLVIWRAVREVMAELLTALPTGVTVGAIGISNQRESVLVWERHSGQPLTPVVVWQCQRSAQRCEMLRAQGVEAQFIERTGLPLGTLFPAVKLSMLLDGIEAGHARAEAGELCAGTIDSWLLWNLTGGRAFATDYSNASRTQLFDIYRGCWDDTLLELLAIPRAILPDVRSSAAFFGETYNLPGVADGIPITAMIGDSHAALFGQGGGRPGVVKATMGTGSSLMAPLAEAVPAGNGLTTTIAWHCQDIAYAFEGNISFAGAASSWLARLCHVEANDELFNAASRLTDNGGVYFVPALSGLGAPYWDTEARGIICGLNTATTTEHLIRASLESIAYQIKDVFDAMERQGGQPLQQLLVDGGPTKNTWLMQFIADLLDRPVQCNRVAEVSALGAGLMAGIGGRLWTLNELSTLTTPGKHFEPRLAQRQLMDDSYQRWQRAVTQARSH